MCWNTPMVQRKLLCILRITAVGWPVAGCVRLVAMVLFQLRCADADVVIQYFDVYFDEEQLFLNILCPVLSEAKFLLNFHSNSHKSHPAECNLSCAAVYKCKPDRKHIFYDTAIDWELCGVLYGYIGILMLIFKCFLSSNRDFLALTISSG